MVVPLRAEGVEAGVKATMDAFGEYLAQGRIKVS
jgi:hypothetical protein